MAVVGWLFLTLGAAGLYASFRGFTWISVLENVITPSTQPRKIGG